MRQFALTLLIVLTEFVTLLSQENYFQQALDYKITVTLDDKIHQIKGVVEMDYTNNSTDTLTEMYFHYWTNAYKDNSSAFAQESKLSADNCFIFANENERGGYKKVAIFQGVDSLKTKAYKGNPDIIYVKLARPIFPGTTSHFTLPITELIPKTFSRIGRSMNGYQMTQWYPKPAVYDREGWHPMPYLDKGEFYSEFGNYKVSITLPENYLVAATGQLEDPAEQQFIANQLNSSKSLVAESSKEVPIPSSDKVKTIHFTANNVHDFAWFADKGFLVDGSKIKLASGREVKTYTYYLASQLSNWKYAINYVNRSIAFYSSVVGEYQYPQATAVFGPLEAGGGMEYPMITIISKTSDTVALDNVITHEIGHNWFYGILASNERNYPWMDEGVNTYYEYRYMDQYHPKKRKSDFNLLQAGLRYQQKYGFDQPLGLAAQDYSFINYGTDIYHKTGIMLSQLANQIGQNEFDKRMKSYYENWKLKHPQPADMATYLSSEDHDTRWFFDRAMHTTYTDDYMLNKITTTDQGVQIQIMNRGQLGSPFKIQGFKNNNAVWTVWENGFSGEKQLFIKQSMEVDDIRLNWKENSLDQNDRNQRISINGKRIRPFHLKLGSGWESSGSNNIYWIPITSYNVYDKIMFGTVLHNLSLPGKKFEFILAPQYSLATKNLAGNATIQYFFPLKSTTNDYLKIGMQTRLYSFTANKIFDYTERYFKLQPYITYSFATKPNTKISNKITLQSTWLRFKEFQLSFDTFQNFIGKSVTHSQRLVTEIYFEHANLNGVNPSKFKSSLQHFSYTYFNLQQRNRIRWINEIKTDIFYSCKHAIALRGYAGLMLYNSHEQEDNNGLVNYQEGVLSLFSNGVMDNLETLDGLFIGRNEEGGLASAQIIGDHNGGFKAAYTNSLTSGISNKYLVAANIQADMPFSSKLFPIKAYLDAGYGPMAIAGAKETKFLWEFGAMLNYQDIFRIHIPIVYHDELKYLYSQTRAGNFLSRISFSLDLQKLNFRYWKTDLSKINLLQ